MKLPEEKALHRAAAYCSKAERCESDVRKKLAGWELTEEEQDRIVKRLKDERFIDHGRYCKSFISDKAKYNKWGEKKIVYELRKKQIEEKYYLPVLQELGKDDFEKQLVHILKVKNAAIRAKDEHDRKNKLMRFALGRGFPMQLVIKCVDNLIAGRYDDEGSL